MFAASKADLSEWLQRGLAMEATHLIVVVDDWDHEDYPVFVKPGESAREIASEYARKDGQRVMEVYDLAMDFETQLGKRRNFAY